MSQQGPVLLSLRSQLVSETCWAGNLASWAGSSGEDVVSSQSETLDPES